MLLLVNLFCFFVVMLKTQTLFRQGTDCVLRIFQSTNGGSAIAASVMGRVASRNLSEALFGLVQGVAKLQHAFVSRSPLVWRYTIINNTLLISSSSRISNYQQQMVCCSFYTLVYVLAELLRACYARDKVENLCIIMLSYRGISNTWTACLHTQTRVVRTALVHCFAHLSGHWFGILINQGVHVVSH